MSATWRSLLRDERGFVISAELVLISTVLVLGLAVALSAVKTALAGELNDVAGAIGKVNQTYYTHGFTGHGSRVYGSAFLDEEDSSDELKADFATGIQLLQGDDRRNDADELRDTTVRESTLHQSAVRDALQFTLPDTLQSAVRFARALQRL